MGETEETVNTQQLTGLIVDLLNQMPEDDRIAFLRDQYEIYEKPGMHGHPSHASRARTLKTAADANKREAKKGKRGRRARRTRSLSGIGSNADDDDWPYCLAKPDDYICCFCRPKGQLTKCGRKNDLKRHIKDHHYITERFDCPAPGCGASSFLVQEYKKHIKCNARHKQLISVHEIDQHSSPVDPTVVFCCGFADCSLIMEAQGERDSSTVWNEFLEHVLRHYDGNPHLRAWSLSTQVRNMLRQGALLPALEKLGDVRLDEMEWRWSDIGSLFRQMELRNIANAEGMIRKILALGRRVPRPEPQVALPQLGQTENSQPGPSGEAQPGDENMSNQFNHQQYAPLQYATPEYVTGPPPVTGPSGVPSSVSYPPNDIVMGGYQVHSPMDPQSMQHTPQTPMVEGTQDMYLNGMHGHFMSTQGVDPQLYGGMHQDQLGQGPFFIDDMDRAHEQMGGNMFSR